VEKANLKNKTNGEEVVASLPFTARKDIYEYYSQINPGMRIEFHKPRYPISLSGYLHEFIFISKFQDGY
jgi:hypothetical protein